MYPLVITITEDRQHCVRIFRTRQTNASVRCEIQCLREVEVVEENGEDMPTLPVILGKRRQ